MDLYEALKAGTSADELIKTFNEDLAKAQERLKQEGKKREAFAKSRKALVEAIYNYIKTFLGDDFKKEDISIGYIDSLLFNTEKELNAILKNNKENKKSSLKITNHFFDDDEVIKQFLDMLK